MLEDFLSYIESNLSVFREDKILLSVSGGVDSMVMLHLFNALDYKIEVAHINHSTRNGGSDRDMDFVEAYCKQFTISFHSTTLDYEDLKKGNFQENARKARFSYLTELKEKLRCKWIATAHHKDDRWETFLMHLNRKSGFRGLTSLRAKDGYIIHPLLTLTKKEIIAYAGTHNVPYVKDESNASLDYDRNVIRHKVSPEVLAIFPDFIENVNQSILHLEQSYSLMKELIEYGGFVERSANNGKVVISLNKIKSFENNIALLYHIIEPFGFNYSATKDILGKSATGAQFKADQYEGLVDRGRFIIRKKRISYTTNILIDSTTVYRLPNDMTLKVLEGAPGHPDKKLWIDRNKIKWPLVVRSVRPGDKFKPLGMKGATKTIKKLCTDLKIDRFTKEDLLVVCQEDIIIQVIGIRSHFEYTTDDIKNALTFNIVV